MFMILTNGPSRPKIPVHFCGRYLGMPAKRRERSTVPGAGACRGEASEFAGLSELTCALLAHPGALCPAVVPRELAEWQRVPADQAGLPDGAAARS